MQQNKNLTPAVLGLGGKFRSGKDTVADYLVSEYGWKKVGMSDALHEFLLAQSPDVHVTSTGEPFVDSYTGIVEHLGYVEAKKLPEIRKLMQRTGTEAGRGVLGEDVWADAAQRRIQKLTEQGYSVALTGVRYPNELAMLRRIGGWSAWVERPSAAPALEVTATQVVSALDAALSHTSENSLSAGDFQVQILNDGSLVDLYRACDTFLAEIAVSAPLSVEGRHHWPVYDH